MSRKTMAVVAWLGLLMAAQVGAAERSVGKAARNEMTFDGDVMSVNLPAREFTVKDTGKASAGEITFQVGRKAKVLVDGQRSSLRRLEKGETVTVTYVMNGTVPVARRLRRHAKDT